MELAAGETEPAHAHKLPELAETDPERLRMQEIFDQVSGQLRREPTQSSRLLQSWIHSD
jgi:flagellar M-ring protein FliF